MNAEHYAILGLLKTSPAHGYSLFKQFHVKDGLGQVITVKKSLFYAYCDQLLEKGLVVLGKEEVCDSRKRHIIEITENGLKEFREWISMPVKNTRSIRRDFLIKRYFIPKYASDNAERLFRDQLAVCESWIEKNQQAEKGDPFSETVERFRRAQIDAVIAWLKQEIEELL